MKRAFIVHGWDGFPEQTWFPWLKKELEKRGFEVQVLKMPNPGHPKIKDWVSHLKKSVGEADEETYLIGHSMGCQTIMRYLEGIDSRIGGAVLVAGFFELTGLETEDEREIAKPWLETEINFDKLRNKARNFVAILSDNDQFVPLSNVELFKRNLGAKVIIEKNKRHLSGEIKELPSVLNSLLAMK